jgi:P27 family predicted phage terminase small subunit
MLLQMKVLGAIDGMLLARYCETFVRWREAAEYLRENGNTFTTSGPSGTYYAQYPEVAIYHNSGLALLKMEQEFGMTPAARARLSTGKGKDDKEQLSPMMKLLSRGRDGTDG